VKSYFPLHSLELKDFLKYWDVLVFVEGAIYQADEDNEAAAFRGDEEGSAAASVAAALAVVRAVLARQGLMTAAIEEELQAGERYWRLERHLCRAMRLQPRIPLNGGGPNAAGFTSEDVFATSRVKSFDYRVLDLILYALRGQTPDPVLRAYLRLDETLVDMHDDLRDYETDVAKNSFNFFRGLAHLAGKNAPLKVVEAIGELERARAAALAALPEGTR
jgi:hypothetical protein